MQVSFHQHLLINELCVYSKIGRKLLFISLFQFLTVYRSKIPLRSLKFY